MNLNVSAITESAQQITEISADVIAQKIAAHVDGDWSEHTQMRYYPASNGSPSNSFRGPAPNNTLITRGSLRLSVVDVLGATVALQIPCVPYTASSSSSVLPVITKQPSSLSVAEGGQARFDVVVVSSTPVVYQWQRNSVNISGATSRYYVIANAKVEDQAVYRVIVTNLHGNAVSSTANLTVT